MFLSQNVLGRRDFSILKKKRKKKEKKRKKERKKQTNKQTNRKHFICM